MRTVPVPHGPDGSVLRFPFPCRSEFLLIIWTDGGRDGLGPSKTVTVRPSRPSRRVSPKNFTTSFSLRKIKPDRPDPPCESPRPLSLPTCHHAVHFKKLNPHLKLSIFEPQLTQDRLHGLHCSFSGCQAQITTAIPTLLGMVVLF